MTSSTSSTSSAGKVVLLVVVLQLSSRDRMSCLGSQARLDLLRMKCGKMRSSVMVPASPTSSDPTQVAKRLRTGWAAKGEGLGGVCRLSQNNQGLMMGDPVNILWGTRAFEEWIDIATSLSALRNLNCGGFLRPKSNLEGDSANPEVALGNALWAGALQLAGMIVKKGGLFILEHPRHSASRSTS